VNESRPSRQNGFLRAAGWLWAAAWVGVLYLVTYPWKHLGGLVSEQLRWTEWFVLGMGFIAGSTVGVFCRDAARPGTGRSHAGLLRFVWLPVAATTAAAMLALVCAARRDAIGVVFTAFLAYWAGLDLSIGAVPLMQGRDYSFRRAIEPLPEEPEPSLPDERVPPWERF
jgi:hypothetical protein